MTALEFVLSLAALLFAMLWLHSRVTCAAWKKAAEYRSRRIDALLRR